MERLRMASAIRAPLTLSGYANDWRLFAAWCKAAGRAALPASAETVGLYLADILNGGNRVSTATRHASLIAYTHRQARLPSPCGDEVHELLCGAQRLRHEQPLHSLRAGFVTAAVVQGVNEIAIMEHTGHRSLSTLRRYYRRGDPFQANACAMVGL